MPAPPAIFHFAARVCIILRMRYAASHAMILVAMPLISCYAAARARYARDARALADMLLLYFAMPIGFMLLMLIKFTTPRLRHADMLMFC